MKLGLRGRLFLSSLVAITAAGLVAGAYLERDLEASVEARVQSDLERTLELGAAYLQIQTSTTVDGLDTAARTLAQAAAARISIIDTAGRVLGDSGVSREQLRWVENHANRPEHIAALKGGTGYSRRRSATVHADMVYAALLVDRPGGQVVLRAATPLSELDEAIATLRRRLLLTGLLGLGLAAALIAAASQFASRQLRDLVDRARRIAQGRGVEPAADGGEVEGIAGSLQHLARELERSVELLARERNRFESVLRGLTEAVVVLDPDGRIVLVNDAAGVLLGLSESPVGKTVLEAVRSAPLKDLVDRAQRGEVAVGELELPGARPRIVRARVAPELAGHGAVGVLVDLTEIRRLEVVRRDFVANVSHELRTPVSVIRTTVEALRDGGLEDPQRARSFVDALGRHAERISRLIEDLLDLSRIEVGQYRLEQSEVPISQAVHHALGSLEGAARSKRIQLAESLPDLSVRADGRALEQVLVNLLDNAVKYTQEGGHVAISARPDGEQVRVEIADDGPGIERRHRERIFERFYRVDPGRSREVGGTGLGLAIVKHLVEGMGGRVGVDGREPRGSVFWFTLQKAELRTAAER